MGLLYLDTETTGFNPGQIAELSFILEENGAITQAKNFFFTVDHMDDDASKVTGLTVENLKELSGGLTFKDAACALFPVFASNTLVAHNLPFDEKFLSMEFWRAGKQLLPVGRFDTMKHFTDICKLPNTRRKPGYKYPKLSEVADYYGVSLGKVAQYASMLFGADCSSLHDSRIDTTLMYVCHCINREEQVGTTSWLNTFKK